MCLDKSFTTVINFYKPIANVTHRQEVMRMYRKALRTLFNWAEDRDVFNVQGLKIRAQFDANKSLDPVADAGLVRRLVREGHERIANNTHPEPYVVPFMPGGTSFMRNTPPPLQACFPLGVPEGISTRTRNIDMSRLPEGQIHADRMFCDSASRSYWSEK